MKQQRHVVTSEMQKKAFDVLYSEGEIAWKWKEIRDLLGFGERKFHPRFKEVAELLGVSTHQFRYALGRDDYRAEDKRKAAARKNVAAMRGTIVTSQKMGFAIWLPDGWEVNFEDDHYDDEPEDPERREKSLRENRSEYYSEANLTEEYSRLKQVMGDEIISLQEFLQQKVHDKEWSEATFQLHLALLRRQKRQSGYWLARPRGLDEEDPQEVEVSRFELQEPLTSLELYELEKPKQEDLSQANRPSRASVIDGLEAIKFYCTYGDRETPAQFSTYMARGLIAWIIDCWSKADDASNPSARALFGRIVSSFHRL